MDDLFAKAVEGIVGAGPFAVLALVVIYIQYKQIERLQTQLLATIQASTAALTEVKAELRAQS